ncbi:MAG: 4Fe-4S binding protein [Thermodesulfobacteriota bacterium]
MISVRRATQLVLLGLFLLLIILTAFPLPEWLPVQRVFALDPLLFLGPLLSSGTLVTGLSVLLVLFLATALLGRFFCGHICPLGTTLDLSRPLVAGSKRADTGPEPGPRTVLGRIKYLLLILGLAAALLGLNLLHWGSPLSLAARFYALVLAPFFGFVLQLAEAPFGFVSAKAGISSFVPEQVRTYQTLFFLVLFFMALFAANRLAPRFWCRYLCPAGAVLGIVGQRPLVRRRVSPACTRCGLCRRRCPMQAIPEDPEKTLTSECILCQTCRIVCPEQAVAFSFPAKTSRREPVHLPGRRAALQAVGLGFLLAFVGGAGRSSAGDSHRIRPPGAVPEELFQTRCLRCGMCQTVCPTNMHQPASLTRGPAGHFTPVDVPRIGPCEPGCNACTRVCPSGAIRILDIEEKMWAKMGTAVIDRQACLAWGYDRSCLVCDEVCPYGAVSLESVEEAEVFVPFVTESKCSGCGFCEHACPVQGRAAIRVSNMWEQRLSRGSYIEDGQRLGLSISRQGDESAGRKNRETGKKDDQGLPPGFSD